MRKNWLMLVLVLCLAVSAAWGEAVQKDVPLVVEDGMLQPVFYVDSMMEENYTNEGKDILRFCVWVETDYDTDLDGKADLVKVLMQVPRAAAEGRYQAGVIYDPTPYSAGVVKKYDGNEQEAYVKEDFDISRFTDQCARRESAGSVTTLEAARAADPSQWQYQTPEGTQGYYTGDLYDYYLGRGYAVAMASGIGTYGSEGFELCGTEWERDSHKAVVEWLAGNRRAFTDQTSDIEIKADWSNGSVAMTGASYGGTLPFSVAVTGVEGLKTIIPFAGIASWYDYTNSQGVSTRDSANETDTLALYNAGACFLDPEWDTLNPEYASWLWTVASMEDLDNGDYSDHSATLDYTLDEKNHIACSALVVQGMNDFNVCTIHADKMVRAFEKAGQKVTLVLHQDGHNFLDSLSVNGRVWQEIMNGWLSHYLFGVENGIENLPAVLAQNNVTGNFDGYESWLEASEIRTGAGAEEELTVITSYGMAAYNDEYIENTQNNLIFEEQANFYNSLPADLVARYPLNVETGITIKGTPQVRVRMSVDREDLDGLMMTATLMDVSDRGSFLAFLPAAGNDNNVPREKLKETYLFGVGHDSRPMQRMMQTETPFKIISQGWTDLQNPGCGFDSFEYVRQEGVKAGEMYEYTFYLMPEVYTLQEGHHLELMIMTWDPYRVYLDVSYELDGSQASDLDDVWYEAAIDNTSIEVILPVDTGEEAPL